MNVKMIVPIFSSCFCCNMGLLLVAFIAVLDMTVTVGSVNGLIFYANVLQAGSKVYMHTKTMSVFQHLS